MDRKTADELGNQTEFDQVVGMQLLEQLGRVLLLSADYRGTETHLVCGNTLFDHLVQTDKCSAAYEQDVACVDLEHLLVRMLASSLGWNAGICSLDDLQQCLLDTFSGNVTCNGDVLALLGNLVDLIDKDNTMFGS